MYRVPLVVLAMLTSTLAGQSIPTQTQGQVNIVKLASPSYPKLARVARVSGTVQLRLEIRPDGTLESLSADSGHPLLIPEASESARKTEFTCNNCSATTSYTMTFKFELGETVYCNGVDATGKAVYDQDSYLKVSQADNVITVFDRPLGTCDMPEPIIKVRSAKCLYLWHCGNRYRL